MIVSHRGEHDQIEIIENSMAAFEKARSAGVGGIEFDVRWTRDLIPVVFHDSDLKRIFNAPYSVADLSMARLQREFPAVPSLEEVIAVFSGRLHLMIELKREHYPVPEQQNRTLMDLLQALTAGRDYHLISLAPEVFRVFNGFPAKAYLPIARVNAASMSTLSIDAKFGGLNGHYAFITQRMIDRHHREFQKIGTGFVHSRNSLFREINRGVDWIFSNRAEYLQNIVNDLVGCDKL